MRQRDESRLRSLTCRSQGHQGARCARPRWQRLKEEGGSGLVEYAFVLILFLSMLFGIGGFGHALYAYHFVSHASKSVTRWAAVNSATCGNDGSCNGTGGMNNGAVDGPAVLAYVKNIAPAGIDPNNITTPTVCGVKGGTNCPASVPSTCTAATPNLPGCTVEVQVSYSFNFIFPLINANPLAVSSTSQMIIAH